MMTLQLPPSSNWSPLESERVSFRRKLCLISGGVAIAHYFPESFSLGGWIGDLTLFAIAWIGRATVQHEARGKA